MKLKTYLTALIALCFAVNHLKAQNVFPSSGAVGIGTVTPDTSSLLEIKSSSKGVLIPRLTLSQRNNITAPKKGLVIFQTSNYPGFYYYDGTVWTNIGYWQRNDSSVFLGSGNVGIGKVLPNYKLDVYGDINMSAKNFFRMGGTQILKYDAANKNLVLGKSNITVTIGSYTLPANDGQANQILKTNGSGAVSWQNDSSILYSAGTGLSLQGDTIINTAPDQVVTLQGLNGITTAGSYPAFTISGDGLWSTSGNSNVSGGFIGTRDATPFRIKVNNKLAGYIDNNSSTASTSFGYEALQTNKVGYNTAFGYNALTANTYGYNNTANGGFALSSNTTGSYNVAMGADALYANSTGNFNVGFGYNALSSNTTGSSNVGIGDHALYSNEAGSYNIAIGENTLYYNTSGSYNTASGDRALVSNTTAIENTAIGASALTSNITGNYNTATGVGALAGNKTGAGNTANGVSVLTACTDCAYNTANGYFSLYSTKSGDNNSTLGSNTLYSTTSSSNNTAVGYDAGSGYNNGNNNVFCGANTDANDDGYSDVIALGEGVICTASHQVRIGNAAITSIGGYADWTNISDGRIKKNIKQNVPGLAFINKLRPVTYNLDLDAADKILQVKHIKDTVSTSLQNMQSGTEERKLKEQIVYTGFVAQEVEKAATSVNYNFSGVDAAKNDKDLYGLRYSEFVVPLVKAVQELSAKNDSLENKNTRQQKEIDNLQNQINELKVMMESSSVNHQSAMVSSAMLYQNIPNPFKNSTTINYFLPDVSGFAKIIITNKQGSVLKQVNLNAKGNGSVRVDASILASGAYQYSLYIDGKLIDTKQMVLAK